MDASDQHLIRDFLAGKEQAFRELSDRHLNLVYGVAMRNIADPSIAEEVVQDVFILLAKKARQLVNHPSLAGWLHNTSRNVARDARRKRLGHQKKLSYFAKEISIDEAAPTESEQHDEIDTAVNALPKKEREVILLRFFEDRDYREIAEQLSISEAAARKRVSRGIERLHSGLRSQLTTGSAMVLVAPASLGETIAASISSTAIPLASSAGTTITTALMTKTTASITCATLLVGTLAVVSVDQNQKRKQLSSELTALQQEMADLRSQSEQPKQSSDKLTTASDSETSQQLATSQQTILDLEEKLSSERAKRQLAEEDAAAAREATAGLEDEVVIAYGKVEEIGADFGSIFTEARALSEIEKAGELDTDENQKRFGRFMRSAASISGLSDQIVDFDNNPAGRKQIFLIVLQRGLRSR